MEELKHLLAYKFYLDTSKYKISFEVQEVLRGVVVDLQSTS